MNKTNRYNLAIMIGLYIAIVLFLVAIILLGKNVQEIKTDPIIYGMDKHDFSSCTCYSPSGSVTHITLDKTKIINLTST